LWEEFAKRDRRFLVQGFRIIAEQLFPYYSDGKAKPGAKELWDGLNKQLGMELELKDLSDTICWTSSTWGGNTIQSHQFYPTITVCEIFVCAKIDGSVSADRFIKERISFIEIAFRKREEEISKLNKDLPKNIARAKLEAKLRSSRGIKLPGTPEEGMTAWNKTQNEMLQQSCYELNERFRQAGYPLNYHNGFVQISTDDFLAREVEEPFWAIVSDTKWKNVDLDMKEAIDLRDTGGRDPAWYAAKALESTIKIISDENGWTYGGEKGAINFLDNVGAKKNNEFINSWKKIL
jgi:hypothetical protein